MKAARLSYLSDEDYLEGEKRSEIRHEYVDGIAYAMTGATKRHNRIVTNTSRALFEAAERRRCAVYAEGVKLRIEARRSYYYPDLIIACINEPDEYFVSQPCALFEVESRETALVDRREKRRAYLTLDSLREYVILAQDEVAATVYRRTTDGEGWIEEQLGIGDRLLITCLDLDLPIDQFYAGL